MAAARPAPAPAPALRVRARAHVAQASGQSGTKPEQTGRIPAGPGSMASPPSPCGSRPIRVTIPCAGVRRAWATSTGTGCTSADMGFGTPYPAPTKLAALDALFALWRGPGCLSGRGAATACAKWARTCVALAAAVAGFAAATARTWLLAGFTMAPPMRARLRGAWTDPRSRPIRRAGRNAETRGSASRPQAASSPFRDAGDG